ncbi:ankyrin repeat family protein [Wolffia australiana]
MSGSAVVEPPPFQEAALCSVCHCSFSAFRRRHHCRCCGRSLCHEHSSHQMALPEYGIYTNVRVCYDCFRNSNGQRKTEKSSAENIEAAAADGLSNLHISHADENSGSGITIIGAQTQAVKECNCGMPLCICATVPPDVSAEVKMSDPPHVRSNPRPVKTCDEKVSGSLAKNAASSSNQPRKRMFFNMNQHSRSVENQDLRRYEVNGEGLREAIKYGDAKAVKKLLDEGVDPNYRDKQGMSLLHLAAVFNQTEISFILLDRGASLQYKNAQGETPLDCAPAMLQYKIRQRMGS